MTSRDREMRAPSLALHGPYLLLCSRLWHEMKDSKGMIQWCSLHMLTVKGIPLGGRFAQPIRRYASAMSLSSRADARRYRRDCGCRLSTGFIVAVPDISFIVTGVQYDGTRLIQSLR